MREATVVALVVAYDGQPFAGFQTQPEADSVQDRLEAALATVLGHPIRVTAAGRTDAGVHAAGQVVSFEPGVDMPDAESLCRSLNALAGPHIVVREARMAVPGFSARHDAISRTYRYRISTGPAPPLFLASVTWWVKQELDVDDMRVASRFLVGEHDFASFCVSEAARIQPTGREILDIELDDEEALGETCLAIRVEGRSFLHSMVRVLVGSLVEVGRGRRDPAWLVEALAAADRRAAGPTAPARGLTLESVRYDSAVWIRPGIPAGRDG